MSCNQLRGIRNFFQHEDFHKNKQSLNSPWWRANAWNISLIISLQGKHDSYQLALYLIIYMKKFLHFDWLRAVQFFSKTVQKKLIQCKKKKQTKHSGWSMIKETYRWPIKSFVFKSSARPGWHNWWRNFSLIAWYTCVSSVLPFQNFFMYIIN